MGISLISKFFGNNRVIGGPRVLVIFGDNRHAFKGLWRKDYMKMILKEIESHPYNVNNNKNNERSDLYAINILRNY